MELFSQLRILTTSYGAGNDEEWPWCVGHALLESVAYSYAGVCVMGADGDRSLGRRGVNICPLLPLALNRSLVACPNMSTVALARATGGPLTPLRISLLTLTQMINFTLD